MQVLEGVAATVTVAGFVQKFENVAIATGRPLVNVSGFGDEWEEFVRGVKQLRGTLGGFLAKKGSGTNPFAIMDTLTAAVVLTFDTGCSISFTAKIGNIQVGASFQAGTQTVSCDFAKGPGSVTVAWDEVS